MRLGEWVRVNLAGRKIRMEFVSDDAVAAFRRDTLVASGVNISVVHSETISSGYVADDAHYSNPQESVVGGRN